MRITSAAAIAALPAGPASALTVFSDDYESGLSGAYSGAGATETSGGFSGVGGISGDMLMNGGTTATVISLSGLAAHTELTISFDLALIESWDGISGGVSGGDWFNLALDGVEILEVSVDAFEPGSQSIPAEFTYTLQDAQVYGSASWPDNAGYVSITMAHTGGSAAISMFADGAGFQSRTDEWWGIDNLLVETNADQLGDVPLPAAAPLLLLGLGGLAAPRRRG